MGWGIRERDWGLWVLIEKQRDTLEVRSLDKDRLEHRGLEIEIEIHRLGIRGLEREKDSTLWVDRDR